MERIALDIMGPLPTTENGKKVNTSNRRGYFTKFIEAYFSAGRRSSTMDDFYVIFSEITSSQRPSYPSGCLK